MKGRHDGPSGAQAPIRGGREGPGLVIEEKGRSKRKDRRSIGRSVLYGGQAVPVRQRGVMGRGRMAVPLWGRPLFPVRQQQVHCNGLREASEVGPNGGRRTPVTPRH